MRYDMIQGLQKVILWHYAGYHPVRAHGNHSAGQHGDAHGLQDAPQRGVVAGTATEIARSRWQIAAQQVTRALNVPRPALLSEQARTAFK
jgi:hypothetical protein